MQVAPKPVAYEICTHQESSNLAKVVSDKLAQGWQPHGDLHILANGSFCQALVKVEFRPIEVPGQPQPQPQPQQPGGSGLILPRPGLQP